MSDVQGFEDLTVWKKSIDFAEAVYRASASWPTTERYGLAQQFRRAATSVSANIAEGAERRGTKEFLHFLGSAKGSLAETRTYAILARRLDYLEEAAAGDLHDQAIEIGRMLSGLAKSLQSKLQSTSH